MAPKLSFSGETLELDEIAEFHATAIAAIRLYHSPLNPQFVTLFAGATSAELRAISLRHEREADRLCSLSAIASLEALLRMDFLRRVADRKKDPLSKAFREIYKEAQEKASLEEHILEQWRVHHPMTARLVSEFKGLLKFRHWLAHGRYWQPRLARDHDFYDVSVVAAALIADLKLAA